MDNDFIETLSYNKTALPLGYYRLKCELGTLDVLGHALIWILLTIMTFGLALIVFPYYMQRYIINKTYVYDPNDNRVGRVVCDIGLDSMLGYIILWTILSIISFGILYFVFLYKIYAHCYSKSKIVPEPV
ncbi:DUF6693 family protein [Oligella urethralis]|uniref:DUF6693 family protein n=1 Tax=Oligella urethralis TaxID=90245 RepID=UPI00037C260D|nr:DUF6693 family protein [Oligella urethralis]AVL71111.1 hypothetical protein CEQ07_06580 [Oligella urethralis]PMC16571.1 hypothetical protein CJ230_08850 [Oligella urethralis]SUA66620.1 Uncharacterised protein [Oligella urethralis]